MRTSSRTPRAPRTRLRTAVQAALAVSFAATSLVCLPSRAGLVIGNNPLFLTAGKANVLITLDNSNSMDEDASGAAVGSASAQSKSEIARGVIRQLTGDYRSRVNMGLMAYKQASTSDNHIHNSPYDVSYDPAHYDPAWTGDRSSQTKKRFRMANPTDPGNYLYYNVALPFYAGSNQGNAFCYSGTADASNNFNNGENPLTGPWDTYNCYSTKTGTSNAAPGVAGSGYVSNFYNGALRPTDSDYAQGILDFGKRLSWSRVGRAWLANTSPGRGYLHVPIKPLDAAQATAMVDKLKCNVPDNPAGCTTTGIKNAGLTPIEGTLLTAKDYFLGASGAWRNAGEGYVASCYPLPTSCGKDFVVLLTDGLPSTDAAGNTLSDPATAIAQAAAAATTLKTAGIETYVIGFALPYGTNPATLDQIAVAGGTVTAYNAGDAASLQAAFKAIFDDIFRKTSSFGSLGQNSTSLTANSRVFQSRFDSTDWSGELLSILPDANGNLTPQWSTRDAGKVPAAAARTVYTYVPGTGGVEFKVLADLSATQQGDLTAPDCSASLTGTDCAQARIDWLRGDASREAPTGPLRKRTQVIGDIISSSPEYSPETNTLYVGANDGMLHAFDAGTGAERFAFVPNAVFPKLDKLTDPNYAHEYFVDGEIAVSTRHQTGGRNILVGSLGRGGRALFALDVTTPSSFSAASVKWEFTDADLGISLGKPFIARLNNGRVGAVVPNGYNSGNERAVLLVIDVDTGAVIKRIDTGAGSAAATNGLSSVRGMDVDGNGTVDIVYGADLLGNLWKFDLSSASVATWDSAHKSGTTPQPMFTATDSTGTKVQPITGGIDLGQNLRRGDPHFGKWFVFFGTGKYLESSDVGNLDVQSLYGLVDDGATLTRSDLKVRTIDLETTAATHKVRAFSKAVSGDMSGKRGWVVDWKPVAAAANGERVIDRPRFLGSVLTVPSMIPSSNVCAAGGDGYINSLDPFTGASMDSLFFDINGDGQFTDADRVGTDKRAIGSVDFGVNLPGQTVLMGNNDRGRMIGGGTSGGMTSHGAKLPYLTGRISWREVVR